MFFVQKNYFEAFLYEKFLNQLKLFQTNNNS